MVDPPSRQKRGEYLGTSRVICLTATSGRAKFNVRQIRWDHLKRVLSVECLELDPKRGQRRWSAGRVQRLCRPGSRGKRTSNFHRILTLYSVGGSATLSCSGRPLAASRPCLVYSGPRRRIKTRWTGVGDIVLDQHWLRKPGANILKLKLKSQSEPVPVAVHESIPTQSFQLWVNLQDVPAILPPSKLLE